MASIWRRKLQFFLSLKWGGLWVWLYRLLYFHKKLLKLIIKKPKIVNSLLIMCPKWFNLSKCQTLTQILNYCLIDHFYWLKMLIIFMQSQINTFYVDSPKLNVIFLFFCTRLLPSHPRVKYVSNLFTNAFSCIIVYVERSKTKQPVRLSKSRGIRSTQYPY